jgi:hypothetical protein
MNRYDEQPTENVSMEVNNHFMAPSPENMYSKNKIVPERHQPFADLDRDDIEDTIVLDDHMMVPAVTRDKKGI